MQSDELKNFSLVGGTALALIYGHRTSIDIDLFYDKEFDKDGISRYLEAYFGDGFEYESNASLPGIFCFINNIKVDIVRYPHSLINGIREIDSIRMYSNEDIAAMKIQAIMGRGRKKDFWDIAEILLHYSVNEMISFHKKKYPSQQLLISIPQALVYFEDAEQSEDPISLKGQSWESVKKYIQQKVNDFLR